nr:MAG TPA: Glutamate receptor, ionotropic kainate 2 receptor, glutamate receptor, MEMBRANE [Caudoviricetes sp.]
MCHLFSDFVLTLWPHCGMISTSKRGGQNHDHH